MYPQLKTTLQKITLSLQVPLLVSIAFEIISGLQIIHLILKVMTDYSQNKAFFIIAFINYCLSYLGEISPNSLFGEPTSVLMLIWIIFAAYFIFHLIVIAYLIISSILPGNPSHRLIYTSISWLYLIHSRIIFFIAHFFFMGLINNYNQCGVEGNSPFYCQIGWFAATILLCSFNIILAIIKEVFLYQILKSKDTYGVKNNLINQIVLIHKGVVILISFLVQDDESRAQICAIMHLVFTLLTIMIIFIKFPFYNVRILKTTIVVNGVILSFCILAILQVIGVEKRVLDIMCTALIPLVIKCLLIGFQILSDRILKGDSNSTEKILFLISLLKNHNFGYIPYSMYGDNALSKGAIVANGVLVHQKFDMEKLRTFDNKKDYEEKVYMQIMDKLSSLLERNPSSKLLLLTMASICLKKLDNIPRTIVLVKRIESLRLSLPVSTSLDAFNKKLEKFHLKADFEANPDKTLNLLNHFVYKEKAIEFQRIMLEEVNKHVELWEEIKRERIDVQKVIEISTSIHINSGLVKKIHETNFRPFTYHFVNPIMMYSVYLELIKEYSDDARKLIKQFWSLTRNQARTQGFDVYCEETGVAIISIERLNTGVIVDASASMQTLFLIDKSRIVGQQLTSILPDFAADYLIKTIKSYAKTPTRNLNSTLVTYGKMPDGNFFEVEVNLRLFPRIEKEVKLMVSFKKISQPKPILIVNTEGVVLEASEPLGKSLDINLKSNTTAPIKFQEICPEFNRINAAFNQKFGGGGHDIIQSFSSKLKSFASAKFLQNNDSRGTVIMQESLPQRSGSAKRQSNSPSPLRVKRTESYFSNPHGNNSIEARGDICEEYMQGSQIMIMQRIDPSNRHLRIEVMHDIQIIPCQINNDIYKILTITQTADEKAQSFHAIPPQPTASKDLIGFVSVGETGESDFADNFTEVDERNPQVIYHKASRSRSIPKSDKPSQNNAQVSDTTNDQKQPAKLLHNNNNEPMERAKLPEREISISSTSSRTVASVKALKSIFSRETTYTLSQRTFIITIIIAIIMIALGIYNYSLSRSASTQVETGVSIVNLASLRLAQSVRGWQYATRIWLRYLGLRTGQVSTLKSSMLEMGQMMLEYNKQFTEELSSLADQDLFSEIMASNIHLWELDESMTTTGAGTDSVTATTILANKLIYIGNTTLDLADDYIRELSTYLCNNTCNDYMVYSESLIDATQKMLQNTLSNNISNMQLILGFEIGAVVVLSLLLFVSGRLVIQLHQKLFRALVKIDEYYLIERLFQVQKMKTLLLQDIETRGYGLGTLENTKGKYSSQALEKAKSDKSKAFRKGVFQKRSERLVLRRVYIDLLKYIFVSFVFVQIITAIFVVSLTQSLASFRNSQSVTNQLSVTAEAAYTSSIAISTVYMDMDFRNTTSMKVRNLSPSSQMTSVMNDISLINNDLTSVFTETGEGIADALIQEIFAGPLCKYLADDTATYDYCITATDNDELGLLALNSKLLSAQEFYVTKYMNTPTYDMAYSILDGYVAIIRPVAEALEGIYNFINDNIVTKFQESTDDFLVQLALLHIGILIAIILSVFVIYRVTIRRFRFVDKCRGYILRTLSYKMLLEDKAIGFYLSRHFVNSEGALSRVL